MPATVNERYSAEALDRLRAHYAALKDKASYDAFLLHGHNLLKRIGADPYHVRMALTKGYTMMEFGNRAAYQHREVDGHVEIGFLIRTSDLDKVEERHKRFEHNFKPAGGMSLIHPLFDRWESIPPMLFTLHEAAMREEYARIKDTTLVEQRRGSGTDNNALLYAMVKGVAIDALPAPTMSSATKEPSYWIFRGYPQFYDTVGALAAGAVRTWSVTAHHDKLKPGDKAIIWVTGPQSGCYALATLTSKVSEMEIDKADETFTHDPVQATKQRRVELTIDHNLGAQPVPWSTLKELPVMAGFNAGTQGTTFHATQEQYNLILQLAQQMNGSNKHSLNTILFGPPGTGKTYHAITHAVAIIDGEDVEVVKKRDRKSVRARYQELFDARLVRTVTFHQSFSYEDFIEGIKPQTHVSKDGEEEVKLVTYEVQDGIFKLMCASARSGERGGGGNLIDDGALEKANFYKVSLGQYNSPADDEIYAYCTANNVIAVGYGGSVDVSKATDEAGIKDILKGAGFKEDGEGFRYTVSVLRTMHLDMKVGDIVLVSAGNSMVRAIGRVSGGYFMDENAPIRFKEFLKVDWLVKDAEMPVEDLYPKSLSMGTLYSLDRNLVKKDFFRRNIGTQEKRHDRYVLIIDEINRGNVASIFGELITLIEDDKRDGGKEPAKVKLPYSKKEDFSVPSNLYLLGTMNTADRSVEALDTALRRRFSFVEMPSQPELIEPTTVADVDLRALLRTINERVEQLMDKDHHIGHSYFMGLENGADLKRVFATKVIPLLEEYFHGDAKKVGAVLGKKFVTPRMTSVKFAKDFPMDEYEVKELYAIEDPRKFVDLEPFKAIYAGS
ncbi:MAG: EVE domain-containing protein [Flavobacteriales bacterium]|nr:EVE domain-containing protein [Flavobacteriales bacterium]